MCRPKSLTSLLTGATAAMIALTGCALYLIDRGLIASAVGGSRIWPMILASSCATLLVMSLLQDELQRVYQTLSKREEQARIDARTDALTGLGNRKFLFEELERFRLKKARGRLAGLILLDLDNFKRVNDTRGHHVGDSLIRAVATRLRSLLPSDVLIRLGGDEFALIVDNGDETELKRTCERIEGAFDAPFVSEGEECITSGSLGATAIVPDMTPSELLRRADIAMYEAKSGRRGYRIFDTEMGNVAQRRARLAEDLRHAITSRDGLSAQFQGIFSRTDKLVAIEALVRWKHPDLRLIPPREIISIAEDTRLLNEVSLVVAGYACRAAHALPDVRVAMNVSSVQLLDGRFRDKLVGVIASARLSPARFEIEVGEQEFVERATEMKEALADLKAAGFVLAVDDFGSSTSSLPYLHKLGVSILKLDPKVLRNSREAASIALMRAKVDLGHALGMKVTSEGIADEQDRAAALQAGCDMLQGYLFGVPEDLNDLLATASRLAAA